MSGEDKRKLGKIQLQRLLVPVVPRAEDTPPSSATRAKEAGAAPVSSGPAPVDLAHVTIAAAALELVPRPVAEAQRVLPLEVDDARIIVAMADPRDARVLDEIGFTSGKVVSPRAADPAALATTIQAAYDALEKGATEYRGPRSRR